MKTRDFFLLDPDNEKFALSKSSRLPAGGQGCTLLFLSVFVLAGLFFAVEIARQWVHFAILSTSYAETQGQVLGRRIESDDGATYYVTYRFVANDRGHTVEESVAKSTYYSVEEGQVLTVRYARGDPAISTIEPGHVGGLLALTGFCLIWNGIVFPVAWLLVREVLRRHKLARDGQKITGEIVHCSGGRDSDGDFELAVRFGFRSPQSGARIEDKDSQIRKDLKDKPLPPPGTPVQVLYLDDESYMVL
jgi:hypothetical protein